MEAWVRRLRSALTEFKSDRALVTSRPSSAALYSKPSRKKECANVQLPKRHELVFFHGRYLCQIKREHKIRLQFHLNRCSLSSNGTLGIATS
jgi:hypothetical protein